jgi:hypothetical protein
VGVGVSDVLARPPHTPFNGSPAPDAPIRFKLLRQRAVSAAKSGCTSSSSAKWPLTGAPRFRILGTAMDDDMCVRFVARGLDGRSIWIDILLRIADHGRGSVNTVAAGFQESIQVPRFQLRWFEVVVLMVQGCDVSTP